MNIKLNWLKISNFKGLKNFELIANGQNIKVYGDNATGKTSIVDAFMWLLFDKDSNNNADTNFKIKPQDEHGKDINHLQTVVEAELLVDGKPLKLKKLREEKWVTRHGTLEPVMEGHTKRYWFDEVPVKAKEYQAKVDNLLNENLFKLITNPLHFNTKLKWEERRQILLKIAGDVTDEQVIAANPILGPLKDILDGKPIEKYKLILTDKLKALKKEKEDIPPRIDELVRSLPQQEPDYTAIEQELTKHKETLQGIEFLLTNAASKADEISKKYQTLAKLNHQLEEVKAKIKSSVGSTRDALIERKAELEQGKLLLENGISSLQLEITYAKNRLEHNAQVRENLLKEYYQLADAKKTIMAEEFTIGEFDTTCPTCGQSIPEDQINAKIEEMKANFEKDKKERLHKIQIQLEQNVKEGKALKANTDEIQVRLQELENELNQKLDKVNEVVAQIQEIELELAKPIPEPNYEDFPEYTELMQKIEALKAELDKPIEDKSSELLARKTEIQAKIDECKELLASKAETEKKKTRIEQLKAEEKRIANLIAELEGHKYLLDQFIVTKVNLLEDKINSKFKHVKFKLFEENITNEGVKETCIALVNTNGSYVPYGDANDAGKLNAGIDIINTLCDFHGVRAPIWIDNRERVTKLTETDSQVISLIVSEPDKALRVEIEQ